MAEFNRDFLLKSEYLNYRNKLFTKDIEKQRIMINLDPTATGTPKTYDFDTNLNMDKIDNVIGFNLIRAGILPPTGFISFDLIIDEIPHKACKINNNGAFIIDLIPVSKATTDVNHYIPSEIPENYFFPISLDKLTITLKSWDGTTYNEDTSTLKGYLEFELVTIKNTEHFNKPNQ